LPGGETQQVSGHAHLTIAVLPGTDSDHRDRQVSPQVTSQGFGHVLQNQRKATGLLQFRSLET
jgi:hypothetical protein